MIKGGGKRVVAASFFLKATRCQYVFSSELL